jgi:predicted GTPase
VAKALKPLVGKVPILLVGNKLDEAKYPEEALKAYHALLPEAEPRMLSALDEKQVAGLKAELLALLPEGPFYYPEDHAKSDQTFGEWVAEIVREEAMKAPVARGALRHRHQGGGGGREGKTASSTSRWSSTWSAPPRRASSSARAGKS